MSVFDGVVQGIAEIVKSIGGTDAGSLVIAAIVVAGLSYVALRILGYKLIAEKQK